MSGLSNRTALEHVANIEVEEHPIYGASPDNYEGHLQRLPKKAIWVKEPECGSDFLSVQDPMYTTIHNEDIFRAMDEVAYDKGLNLKVDRATYHKGKTMVNFFLPDEEFKVPGDPSPIRPGLFNINDFGGGSAWKLLPSSVSMWCSNGMMVKQDLAAALSRRHVGVIEYVDVYLMVAAAFQRLDTAVQLIKLTTSISAVTAVTDEQIAAFLKGMEEKVAKKYQDKLAKVIQENVTALGQTAWGVTQGITEMYTHHMDAPEHGGTKLAWRDNAVDSLLRSVGVAEQVKVRIGV